MKGRRDREPEETRDLSKYMLKSLKSVRERYLTSNFKVPVKIADRGHHSEIDFHFGAKKIFWYGEHQRFSFPILEFSFLDFRLCP